MTVQRKLSVSVLTITFLSVGLLVGISQDTPSPKPQPVQAKFEILNRQGTVINSLIDGDWVKLKVALDQESGLALAIAFSLGKEAKVAARCIVPQGQRGCETDLLPALGWYWGKDGKAESDREIRAATADPGLPKELQFTVSQQISLKPRPVVLVHGLGSNATTWSGYTKQDGFLASIGLRGFAVGDGQVEGAMSAGEPAQPLKRTNTIAQNAEILGRYIAGVKKATGAQTVDILAHSLGGLISRYYIDRVMADRDIAQLIMLGTPHGGTDCACLPSSLGFYVPAALELRPAYLIDVFNRQITRRRGVPFYMLAGTSIVESFKAPCTDTPSDLLVSSASVKAITAPVTEMPFLHNVMTGSEAIFKDFVASHLKKQADEFPAAPDPLLPKVTSSPVQFTKVFTGHIDAGGSQELTVNLDRVSIASFALFDSTRSLKVTVRGASGNVIALDRNTHGLIEVSDPATIVNLGYGFENPNPGPWKVRLDASAATPRGGADFALSAKVIGGATLRAQADRLIPQAGQPVTIKASLELADNPMNDAVLQGLARGPDGKRVELKFEKTGNENRAVWTPNDPGVYAIDVTAKGVTPDGMQVERTDFLSVEVEPDPNRGILAIVLAAIGLLTVVTLIGFWLKQRFGRKVKRSGLEL